MAGTFEVTKVRLTGVMETDLQTLVDFLVLLYFSASVPYAPFIGIGTKEGHYGTFRYHPESLAIDFNFMDPGRAESFEKEMRALLC